MTGSEFILDKLGKAEALAQLAEESAELAQAALKLRRAITGNNPTPVSTEDATANLIEEFVDVANCIDVLGVIEECDNALEIMDAKRGRWVKRLMEGAK